MRRLMVVMTALLLVTACSDDSASQLHPTDTGVHSSSTVQVDDGGS